MFSLKDFIEKKEQKAREEVEAMEEEEKVMEEEEKVRDEEDEVAEKKAADSSEDESVIDDEESMMMQEDDDDSDLEVIVKSDKDTKEKKIGNEMDDSSDIENEITKLHDIIGELSKSEEKDLKEEEVKIVDEKTCKDPKTILPTKVAFESQPKEESIGIENEEMSKPEKAELGQFSGLSIKKKNAESESKKKPDHGYNWQNMEKEDKTGKNDDEIKIEGMPVFSSKTGKGNEEVKIEGTPVFSEMRNETPVFWSAPNSLPTIAGLPPGLKVEIKEVQGKRWEFFSIIFCFFLNCLFVC